VTQKKVRKSRYFYKGSLNHRTSRVANVCQENTQINHPIPAAFAATGVLPDVLKVPHAPEKVLLPCQQAKRAVCAKFDFWAIFFCQFSDFFDTFEIPSVISDRFENIPKF
jgi:hypothetical protein